MTKHAGMSSVGTRVAQVAVLQMVQQDLSRYSPEYTPASPSPPCHRVTRAKVGRGKVLIPRWTVPAWISRRVRCTATSGRRGGRGGGAALRLCLNNMDERVAETEIDRMELGDRVDTLRKAVCSKIKHLAKATGNEDLYRSPDPK